MLADASPLQQAQAALAIAQQQYGVLVSGGVATPQNVGNFNVTAPEVVADQYNAWMSLALATFHQAATLAQQATAAAAASNPNAAAQQRSSAGLSALFSQLYGSAAACANRSVTDPATGVCCDPNSCSWNTQTWTVQPIFLVQTEQVASIASQLVSLAAQATAAPKPAPKFPPRVQLPIVAHWGMLGDEIVAPMAAASGLSSPVGLAFVGATSAATAGFLLEEVRHVLRKRRGRR